MRDTSDDSWSREALRRLRRQRARRWLPMGLFGLSLAVAGVGVVQAYQAQRSHEETARDVLTDYGVFAATGFRQSWGNILQRSLDATLSNARGAALRQATTQQCLETLLVQAHEAGPPADSCGCGGTPLVGAGSWAFHLTLDGRAEPGGFFQGEVPGPELRDRMMAEVVRFARREFGASPPMLHWVDIGDGEPRPFAFAVLEAYFSEDTVVYGVEADPARVRATFVQALSDGELLPPALTGGTPSRELLAVSVVRDDGEAVFASSPGAPMELAGEQELPARIGGGAVRASVLPEAADALVIGGLPTDRVPLLLAVFGLAALLALLAVYQFRKEEAFARQRQDFVAGVSHELRTPLAQIRLFTETLKLGRTRTEEERDWALGNIDRETLRLARLVENILHFSRAERGQLDALEREPLDLAGETRTVVESFEPLLAPHQATIVVDVEEGLMAEAHRDSVRQVLLNLLDNAVKYGPRGQTVRVEARGRGDVVRLSVSDEGPGVPAQERRSIWRAFRRGDDAVGSVATGSGIGLSVVREIVGSHGGRAWVEDAGRTGRGDGPGARFVVELPRLRTVGADRLVGREAAAEEGSARSGGAGRVRPERAASGAGDGAEVA